MGLTHYSIIETIKPFKNVNLYNLFNALSNYVENIKNGVYTRCIWMKWYLMIKLCYFFYWGNTQVMMPKGSWTKSDTVECYIHGYNPNKFRNHGKILLIIRQATLIRIIIIVIILDVWAPFSLKQVKCYWLCYAIFRGVLINDFDINY